MGIGRRNVCTNGTSLEGGEVRLWESKGGLLERDESQKDRVSTEVRLVGWEREDVGIQRASEPVRRLTWTKGSEDVGGTCVDRKTQRRLAPLPLVVCSTGVQGGACG